MRLSNLKFIYSYSPFENFEDYIIETTGLRPSHPLIKASYTFEKRFKKLYNSMTQPW